MLLVSVMQRPDTTAPVWNRFPDIHDPEVVHVFTLSVAWDPDSAAAVFRACPTVREPRLLAAVARNPTLLNSVLADGPALREVLLQMPIDSDPRHHTPS